MSAFLGHFTLLELLVVVAVIAILASLLLPALAKARGRTKQTACMSNFKQIAQGSFLYESDWHRLPNLNRGWLGSVGFAGPAWRAGWSSAQIAEAIANDHFAQFSAGYLGATWRYDQDTGRMVVPKVLACPGLPAGVAMNSYMPYFGAWGPTTRTDGKVSIGDRGYYDVFGPLEAGGGAAVGFASFLGLDDGLANADNMLDAHTRHLMITQLTEPEAEVILLDLLLQRGGHVQTIDPSADWCVPHGAEGLPDGLNQGFADGSVQWIPFKRVNRVHRSSLDAYLLTGLPFYASPQARLNRGGYPTSKPSKLDPRFYGLGVLLGGTYQP